MNGDSGGIEIQLSDDGTYDNSSVRAQFPFSRGETVSQQRSNELERIPESGDDLKAVENRSKGYTAKPPRRQEFNHKSAADNGGNNRIGYTSRLYHNKNGNKSHVRKKETRRERLEKRVDFRDDVEYSPESWNKAEEFIDNDEEHMREHSDPEEIIRKNHHEQNAVPKSLDKTQGSNWLPNRLVVERVNSNLGGKERGRSNFGGSKKKVAIILAYIVLIGLAGWLIQEYLKIPGLYDEINALSTQIDRLSFETDRLKTENDRLEGQVDRLEGINDDLEKTASQLNEENERAADLASEFNNTLVEFQHQNELLRDENSRYIVYTNELNQTVDNLVAEVAEVRESEENLANTVEQFAVVAATLESEILILTNQTGDLNETVSELNEAVALFVEENQQFRELNENLGKIVSFLEVEANGVQESYDELAKQLADTILRKEVLAEIGLKERMKAELSGWECGLLIAFGNQDFSEDQEIPIGYSDYYHVMNYISDKILSDLCIVQENLEVYLWEEVIPGKQIWDINLKDLAFGVNIYSAKVLDHYFPDENDTEGLENYVWNVADYDCRNLDLDDRYLYIGT